MKEEEWLRGVWSGKFQTWFLFGGFLFIFNLRVPAGEVRLAASCNLPVLGSQPRIYNPDRRRVYRGVVGGALPDSAMSTP